MNAYYSYNKICDRFMKNSIEFLTGVIFVSLIFLDRDGNGIEAGFSFSIQTDNELLYAAETAVNTTLIQPSRTCDIAPVIKVKINSCGNVVIGNDGIGALILMDTSTTNQRCRSFLYTSSKKYCLHSFRFLFTGSEDKTQSAGVTIDGEGNPLIADMYWINPEKSFIDSLRTADMIILRISIRVRDCIVEESDSSKKFISYVNQLIDIGSNVSVTDPRLFDFWLPNGKICEYLSYAATYTYIDEDGSDKINYTSGAILPFEYSSSVSSFFLNSMERLRQSNVSLLQQPKAVFCETNGFGKIELTSSC